MGDAFPYIDIVFLAVVAGFLALRLHGVLGRRTGNEQQRPNPFIKTETPVPFTPPVPAPEVVDEALVPDAADDTPPTLAAGLQAIRAADPSFDEHHFVRGAKGAFTMIVEAFAAGDTQTLQPLLDRHVYDSFAGAIQQRQQAGETLETTIVRVVDADPVAARVAPDGTAFLTVRFVSDQVNVTRDAAGNVVDGSPDKKTEIVDVWTFSRKTRAQDPNWFLVETSTAS